jgi:hypothetical protein
MFALPHTKSELYCMRRSFKNETQEERITNLDEMKFTLNGNDEQAGGRPTANHTTSQINESGHVASDNSDNVCTLVFGVAGNEPLPPLVIFPTSAKNAENYKINPKSVGSFNQIGAKYVYPTTSFFDCTFAVSPKGSMTNDIFEKWICETVTECFPDINDIDRFRVMINADSGPGRHGTNFLGRSNVEGLQFFPGLPNGTECGQVMDQLFGAFKASNQPKKLPSMHDPSRHKTHFYLRSWRT